MTSLVAAAMNGHTAMVDVLLRAGARVDATDRYGYTALHKAANNGYPDIVQRLLRAGASPVARTPDGTTPLTHACVPAVVAALLDAGGDPNLGSADMIPLIYAVAGQQSRTGIGKVFREGEADDPVATVRLLLARGAEVNRRGHAGMTPLMFAAEKSSDAVAQELVRLLLAAGADPNLRDNSERTALSHALMDYRRDTPQDYKQRVLDTVRMLLKAGAVDRPDAQGKRALDIAVAEKAGEIAELLRSVASQ